MKVDIFDDNVVIDEEERLKAERKSLADRAFVGEYPFLVLIEEIEKQFEDYINNIDMNNYVDIFYQQYQTSYELAKNDLYNPELLLEVLDRLMTMFVIRMNELFNKRLTIGIPNIDAGIIDDEEIEFIFRKLYEFFILNARSNFITSLSEDVLDKMEGPTIEDDEEFYALVNEMLDDYNPLILTIDPMKFIKLNHDNAVYKLFKEGNVNGNFLRKYSPKLYQNNDLRMEIVNNIVLLEAEELEIEEE